MGLRRNDRLCTLPIIKVTAQGGNMDLQEIKRWQEMPDRAIYPYTKTVVDWLISEVDRLTQLCEEQGKEITALRLDAGVVIPKSVRFKSLEFALTQVRDEVKRMEEKHEEELRRWQDEIRGAVIDASGASDCDIDGGGCDSGDPLDLTLTEISQGFVFLKEAAEQSEKGLLQLNMQTQRHADDLLDKLHGAERQLKLSQNALRLIEANYPADSTLPWVETARAALAAASEGK